MQIKETLNEGLNRVVEVTIAASDLHSKLEEKLKDLKGKISLKGFRPGKVPESYLRKIYSKSLMVEIINEVLTKSVTSVLQERSEKSSMSPELLMTEDEQEIAKIIENKSDLVFSLKYEVLPTFEIQSLDKIEIERPLVDVDEKEISEQAERLLSSTYPYKEKKGKAENGDRLTINYVGKIDDKAFENGSDNGAHLILGSKQFIPGFEEQLVGSKAGDKVLVNVTFPENYNATDLAGVDAVFEVDVLEVSEIDKEKASPDEAVNKLGVKSLDHLKELIKNQVESQYGKFTRQKIKHQIFEQFAKDYTFTVPENLVNQEFNYIWSQLLADLKARQKTFEDEQTTEEEAKEEYLKIAERRVRLGLVVAAIGDSEKITATEEDLQRAIFAETQRYPDRKKEIFEYFQKNPQALADLRAPIIEEKVVDRILEKAKVTDKKVSAEELMSEETEEVSEKPKKTKSTNAASKAKKESPEKNSTAAAKKKNVATKKTTKAKE